MLMKKTVLNWRESYEAKLQSEHGWLSTIALTWLTEGDNLLGSSSQSVVALAKTRVPELLGVVKLESLSVYFECAEGLALTYQGKSVRQVSFVLPANGNSDLCVFDDFAFSVIRRGDQFGLRVFDREAESRHSFQGFNWFSINEDYCIEADFVAYEKPQAILVTNILGATYETVIPGEAQFYFEGNQHTLLPVRNKKGLFFVFKDLSSESLSYAAGRFLTVPEATNNKLTLDFNKCHNPPCAFTPFATCPLPFQENYMSISLLAGEMRPTI